MSRDTYNYKRQVIAIAKDFRYPETVISRLKEAQTDGEIARIMRTAREKYL